MSDIGTAYVKIAPSTGGLSGAINKAFQGQGANAGRGLGSSASGGFLKSGFAGAVGGAFALAVSKGVSTVSSAFSDAASRYDTINNFPNVMKNFGIEGDKASAAMDKLDKGLSGLPTTMDAAASGVQNITGATGNVGKATDVFLSLNNAILAGGKPMEVQASAMEQFTQAFSKGKPDMVEWKSLQQAMPAQLEQVAKAMDYTGKKGVTELGEDLRSGNVSMEEFTDTLISLNEKGVKGFPSLAEQAKNATGGIKTGMSIMRTTVVRGVTDMMNALDTGLKGAGLGGLFSLLDGASKKIDSFFKGLKTSISTAMSGLSTDNSMSQNVTTFLTNISQMFTTWVTTNLPRILTNGIRIATTLVQGITDAMPQIIPALVTALNTLVNAIVENAPTLLTAILDLGIALLEGLVQALPKIIEMLPVIIDAIVNFFTNNIGKIMQAAVKLFLGLVKAIPVIIKALVPKIPSIIKAIVKGLLSAAGAILKVGAQLLGKLWSGIKSKIGWIKTNVVSFAKSIPTKIAEGFLKITSVGSDLIKGLWNGIKSVKDWVIGKIKGFSKSVLDGIKSFFKIKSPSRVMTWVGQMLGLGFEIGTMKSLDHAENKINSKMSDMLSGFSTAADIKTNTNFNASNQSQTMVSDMLTGFAALLQGAKNEGDIVVELNGDVIARDSFSKFAAIAKQKGVVSLG